MACHAQVTVDGYSFNTDGVQYCEDLFGWLDSADLRVDVSEYGLSDGVVAADRFPRKEQVIEFRGLVVAADLNAARAVLDQIKTLFDHDDPMTVVRYDYGPRAMTLRRSGRVEVTRDFGRGFRFIVTLMATWPFKTSLEVNEVQGAPFTGSDYYRVYDDGAFARYYGPLNERVYLSSLSGSGTGSLPDTLTLVNGGNAYAYPTILINGPLLADSWAITNETLGDTVTFGLDISTGATLTLDSLGRVAHLAGQDVEYYVSGTWPRLAPGPNVIRLSTGTENTGATFVVRYQDTWK